MQLVLEPTLPYRKHRRFQGKLTIERIGDDSKCGFGVESVGFAGGELRTGQAFQAAHQCLDVPALSIDLEPVIDLSGV